MRNPFGSSRRDGPIGREAAGWRRWLVGLALGVLIAVVLLPGARWIVMEQARLQAGVPRWGIDPRRVPSLAARVPSDFLLQLAAASQDREQVEGLRALRERFPDQPALYAAILRREVEDQVVFDRLEPSMLEDPHRPLVERRFMHRGWLAEFEADAAAGERLEPDNAYFPLMLAAACYAGRSAKEGLAAIQRAGEQPRWDDHYVTAAVAEGRLSDAVGQRGALHRVREAYTLPAPHLAAVLAAARWATRSAARAEREGRTAEGLAIRRAVARCGSRIRVQSRSAIGSLTGIAMVRTGFQWPGGKWQGEPLHPGRPQTYPVEPYLAYLERLGERDEARWVRTEERAGRRTRALLNGAREQWVTRAPLATLVSWWVAGLLLLANAAWLLGLGAVAAWLARTRPVRAGRPLPIGTTRGLWCALATAAAGAALVGGGVLSPLELALVSVLAFGTAWGYVILCRRSLAPSVGVACGVPLLMVVLGLLLMVQTGGLVSHLENARLVAGVDGGTGSILNWTPAEVRFAAVLAPLLTLVMLAIASRVLRVPLSVGLVRGFRGASVPLACLLLLVYGGTVFATMHQEARVESALERTLAHEGRYLAESMGAEWPGEVEPR